MADRRRGTRVHDAVQGISAVVIIGWIAVMAQQNLTLRGLLESVESARAATVTDSAILDERWYEPLGPVEALDPVDDSAAKRVVLVVVRQDCATCGQVLEQWRTVMADPPAAPGAFDVWIATPDGLPVEVSPTDLATSKVRVRLLRIRNPEDFARVVGVQAVPVSLAVAETSILAAVAGPPSPNGLAALLSRILDRTLQEPTYLFMEWNPGRTALMTLPATTEDAFMENAIR